MILLDQGGIPALDYTDYTDPVDIQYGIGYDLESVDLDVKAIDVPAVTANHEITTLCGLVDPLQVSSNYGIELLFANTGIFTTVQRDTYGAWSRHDNNKIVHRNYHLLME